MTARITMSRLTQLGPHISAALINYYRQLSIFKLSLDELAVQAGDVAD